MDKIIAQYLLLTAFLVIAALWDIFFCGIPVWVFCFGFFGRVICFPEGLFPKLFVSCLVSLFVFFICSLAAKIRKTQAIGIGDIYIIFIINLYTGFEVMLKAVFLSCLFALLMVLEQRVFEKGMPYGRQEFPLGAAFLFGTAAALW